MEKVILGSTGIEVSKIGFGVLPIGASQKNLSLEEGRNLIEYAISKGINFFDTAQYYDTYKYMKDDKGTVLPSSFATNCQKMTGEPSPCHLVISSKCLFAGYEDMMDAIHEACRELNREYIDIFLLHEVQGEEDFKNRSGAMRALTDAKEQGLIRATGLSTHHQDVCDMAADVPEIDVVFPLINKDGLGIRLGGGPGTARGMAHAINKCSAAGKGVYAMKVFGGGNLCYEYKECMDFVSSIEGVDAIVIGFTTKEEIDRAVEYAEGALDPTYVPDVSKKMMYVSQDDCIGCGACRDRCPNKAIKINESGLSEIDHSICITCGYCAPVCPVRALIMY